LIDLVDNVITRRHAKDTPNHVLGELPTGSGKTLAALIPAIAHLQHERAKGNKDVGMTFLNISLIEEALNGLSILARLFVIAASASVVAFIALSAAYQIPRLFWKSRLV
jgi:Rad3-related DNA helicase